MSDWAYVAIAYTVVWGALAVYALLLTRRVAGARQVARQLREVADAPSPEQDRVSCDAPPAG